MQWSEADLRELASEGEGRRLEFKRGLPQAERVARILCAFANTNGGMLLVGVSDRGALLGVPNAREVAAALRAAARELVVPPLDVQLVAVALAEQGGMRVVCCSVPLSPARPHRVQHPDGREETVVRVGSSNRAAQGETLRAIARPAPRSGLDPLERSILRWVEGRTGRGGSPDGDATVARFAAAHNVGLSRARRAFTRLEREGRIVGHGPLAKRVYAIP